MIEDLHPVDVEAITANLPTNAHDSPETLDSAIRAIHSEPYWRKCCMARWKNCHEMMQVSSWKQLYMEHHVRDLLEPYAPGTVGAFKLQKELGAVVNFVHSVEVRQLLSHLSPVLITDALPKMTKLKVTFSLPHWLRVPTARGGMSVLVWVVLAGDVWGAAALADGL